MNHCVSNCDIIINTDYRTLYEFHKTGGYDLTLVASVKEFLIPCSACKLNEEGHLANIDEKPSYDFLINTGFYILNQMFWNLYLKTLFHITHLIEKARVKE